MADLSRAAIARNNSYLSTKMFLYFCIFLVGSMEVYIWYQTHYFAAFSAFVVNCGRPILAVALSRAEKEGDNISITRNRLFLKGAFVFTLFSLVTLLFLEVNEGIDDRKLKDPLLMMASVNLNDAQSKIKYLEEQRQFSPNELSKLAAKYEYLTAQLKIVSNEAAIEKEAARKDYDKKLALFMNTKYLCSWTSGTYKCFKSNKKGSYTVNQAMTEDCVAKRLWGGAMIRASTQLCQFKPKLSVLSVPMDNKVINLKKQLADKNITRAKMYIESLELGKQKVAIAKAEYMTIFKSIDEDELWDPTLIYLAELSSGILSPIPLLIKPKHISMLIVVLLVVLVLMMITSLSVFLDTMRDPIISASKQSLPKKNSFGDNILSGIKETFAFFKSLIQKKSAKTDRQEPVKPNDNLVEAAYQESSMGFGPRPPKHNSAPDTLNLKKYAVVVGCIKEGLTVAEINDATGIDRRTIIRHVEKWKAQKT